MTAFFFIFARAAKDDRRKRERKFVTLRFFLSQTLSPRRAVPGWGDGVDGEDNSAFFPLCIFRLFRFPPRHQGASHLQFTTLVGWLAGCTLGADGTVLGAFFPTLLRIRAFINLADCSGERGGGSNGWWK